MTAFQPERDLATLPALAERLAAQFSETAAENDHQGTFPFTNLQALKEAGIFRLLVPRELGGWGGDLADCSRFMRAISAGDGPTGLILTQHFAVSGAFARRRNRGNAVIDRFLAEHLAKDEFVPLFTGAPEYEDRAPTTARRVDGGFVIRGRKGFGTGVLIADWALSQATWADAPGGTRTVMVLYAIKQPAVKVLETWDTFGMRATASHDFLLDDVFVPDGYVVVNGLEEDERNAPGKDNLYAGIHPFGTTCFASVYLGIADAALDFTRDMLKKRTALGGKDALGLSPTVQTALGEIDVLWREAVAMLEWTVERNRVRDPLDPQANAELSAMKDSVTRKCVAIVEQCFGLLGGVAYSRRSPIERYYRDVRAGPIHPPNHAVTTATLGRLAVS